jgi:hypothetical protein
VVNTSITENVDISLLDNDVEKFRIQMVKEPESKHYADFSWSLIIKGRPYTLLSDPDCKIRSRMMNFYRFDDDLDFIFTFLYYVGTILKIPYIQVSDSLLVYKIKSSTTDVSDADKGQILKSFEIDLKEF